MKLSIVIPVYRVEHTLDRCLRSIAGQSFTDFEVILVDDGSPDGSPEMCDKWAAADSRFTVIHQSNKGLSAARNTGIDRAAGELITFVDSDDYIGCGTLQEVMEAMPGNDICEYPVSLFHDSPHQSRLNFEDKVYTKMNSYWLDCQAYRHAYAWNKVYRRQLFDGVRYPEGRVFEDVYVLPQLLSKARRVATTSKGLYYYCWNDKGITTTAGGNELRMLLDAHLSSGMPVDDRYYLHLLNIQMDVWELTGDDIRLPKRKLSMRGDTKEKTKAIALNILGINTLCKINKALHKIKKPSRS